MHILAAAKFSCCFD